MTAARSVAAVRVATPIAEAMRAHARYSYPIEACGLVAFDISGTPRFVYPCTNLAGSAVRYLVDPTEHFRAIQHAESCGWSIDGVFHSHPEGDPVPSAVDVAEAADPQWVYFLVGRKDEITAWRISGRAESVPLEGV